MFYNIFVIINDKNMTVILKHSTYERIKKIIKKYFPLLIFIVALYISMLTCKYQKIQGIIAFLLGLSGLLYSFLELFKSFKNEKIAKIFRQNLRKGDKVSFQTQNTEGEIVDLDPLGDGNYIKVSTIVPINRIYP